LSEEALASFKRFFLEARIDKVTFMESLMPGLFPEHTSKDQAVGSLLD
jgi:hypothetical protein